jgi:SAM-dependent methyltransferase/tetratricopeptide (TPR) repeat protein
MGRDDASWAPETEALLAAGRLEAAEARCTTRLTEVPGEPTALSLLSFVRMKQGLWEDAEAILRAACLLHPTRAALHATLGAYYLRLGRFADAVDPLQACVLLEPRTHQHRVTLVAVYEKRQFAAFSEDARRAMLACLADDALTHSLMARAWLSLLRLDPAAADTLQWFASPDYSSFQAGANPERWAALEDNEFLTAGLTRFLVPDPIVERGLTHARRWLLEEWAASGRSEPSAGAGPAAAAGGAPSPAARLPFVCTLARACFLGEYVLAVEEDPAPLRRVPGSSPAGPAALAAQVALLACYEALFRHPDARRLATVSATAAGARAEAAFRDLVRVQIHEPLKELKLASGIAALGPIEDRVSRAVQAQYEENPYPRWTTIGRAVVPPGAVAAARGRNILVAGCGTGREAIEVALIFPAARIDALDLSRTSLAYAVRMARELGARNAFFLQGDLLDVRRLRKTFDFVVSSGVLHHLQDPAAGLRELAGVLGPGGVLKVGLYSTRGRAEITEARAFASAAGFEPTLEGIRAFRAAVLARPTSDPVRQRLTSWDDFYAVSACRDLVFHVQEHTFTLPEIDALVGGLGLAVFAVEVRNPAHLAAYRARFPDDPEAATLAHWDALERDQPTLFAGMYSLWLCRADERAGVDVSWIASTGRM